MTRLPQAQVHLPRRGISNDRVRFAIKLFAGGFWEEAIET